MAVKKRTPLASVEQVAPEKARDFRPIGPPMRVLHMHTLDIGDTTIEIDQPFHSHLYDGKISKIQPVEYGMILITIDTSQGPVQLLLREWIYGERVK